MINPINADPEPIAEHIAMFLLLLWPMVHALLTSWREGLKPTLQRRFEQPGRRQKTDF